MVIVDGCDKNVFYWNHNNQNLNLLLKWRTTINLLVWEVLFNSTSNNRRKIDLTLKLLIDQILLSWIAPT